jgi:hypothetical protein
MGKDNWAKYTQFQNHIPASSSLILEVTKNDTAGDFYVEAFFND